MTPKTCTKCGVCKELAEFHVRNASRDGLSPVCKPCAKAVTAAWQKSNPLRMAAHAAKYNASHKKEKLAYARNCRAADPRLVMASRCRARLGHALKNVGFTKRGSTLKYLGCDWGQLIAHIEDQFTGGMSWGNRGQWHLDHIMPFASAKTEKDIVALAHYTNIQPLWAKDNLVKGGRYQPIHEVGL